MIILELVVVSQYLLDSITAIWNYTMMGLQIIKSNTVSYFIFPSSGDLGVSARWLVDFYSFAFAENSENGKIKFCTLKI